MHHFETGTPPLVTQQPMGKAASPLSKKRELKPRSLGLDTTLSTSRRDALIHRCLNRVRSERDKRLNELRKGSSPVDFARKRVMAGFSAKTLLTQELESPVRHDQLGDLGATLDSDDILKIEQAIEEEIQIAEGLLQEEYEEVLRIEQEETDALTEYLDTLDLCGDDQVTVVCPICSKYTVGESKCILFCRCGFRIDASHISITLGQFRQRLSHALELHQQNYRHSWQTFAASDCRCTNVSPRFRVHVDPQDGSKQLLLECTECHFSHVVI